MDCRYLQGPDIQCVIYVTVSVSLILMKSYSGYCCELREAERNEIYDIQVSKFQNILIFFHLPVCNLQISAISFSSLRESGKIFLLV